MNGVIVVLSGGWFDLMNPPEVLTRMDQYVAAVPGLDFALLPDQQTPHLHQTQWRAICAALQRRTASPLILVGHSNGGAAVMNLAHCLQGQGQVVDLLWTADSVSTLDDIGSITTVPDNVTLNVNTYVRPTGSWWLAPFPFGRPNRRPHSMDGVLNIGLAYNLPGALAHRNAFYELAGGDDYRLPNLLLDVTEAALRGDARDGIIRSSEAPLQRLASMSRLAITIESADFTTVLEPRG